MSSSDTILVMSGHSKWSTIKRQKEAKDAARGQVFSKLSRAISVAVKAGGGENPDSNAKLRMAIDAARAANMPKDNIERAISRAKQATESIEEVVYEGFGPGGIGIIVDAATDNRNRTGQEIKNIFDKGGGSFAPGAVTHNFEHKGFILVKKKENKEKMILDLIDLGVEEFEESEDGIEVYTAANELFEKKSAIEKKGFKVEEESLIKKPKNKVALKEREAQKALNLLENLEEHEDVQGVYTNADILNQ